jgi:hypothetical protein
VEIYWLLVVVFLVVLPLFLLRFIMVMQKEFLGLLIIVLRQLITLLNKEIWGQHW